MELDEQHEQLNIDVSDNGNFRSGVIGAFGCYVDENFVVSVVLCGSCSHCDCNLDGSATVEGDTVGGQIPIKHSNGYSICGTGDVRYKLYKNEKFVFGPLVALSYLQVSGQFDKTLIGEVGVYGTYDCCVRSIPVKMYSSVTFADVMSKPDACTNINVRVKEDTNAGFMLRRTSEPSSYINVSLGVTSAVSESIDLNADVKASFANDYYDIMGAVGMSYNF